MIAQSNVCLHRYAGRYRFSAVIAGSSDWRVSCVDAHLRYWPILTCHRDEYAGLFVGRKLRRLIRPMRPSSRHDIVRNDGKHVLQLKVSTRHRHWPKSTVWNNQTGSLAASRYRHHT
jgi:hypothetical protein